MANSSLPSVTALRSLVTQALKQSGGKATTAELRARVELLGGFTPAQLADRHGDSPGSELHYRLRWALVDLRRRGVVTRVAPRTWSLVDVPAADPPISV